MAATDNEAWQTLLEQARGAWEQEQVHDALQLCDRAALLGDMGRYRAALLRGDILLDLGDAAGALSSYDSVAEPSVQDAELDAARGIALLELARFAEAENALTSALRGTPNNADVLFALGLIAEVHHSGREVEFFRRARKLEPQRYAATPRLNPERFEAAVAEALHSLASAMGKYMRQVPVLIADVPHPQEIRLVDPPVSPLSFGMWVDLSQSMGPSNQPGAPSERGLLLFKRNLERASPDYPTLVAHIKAFVEEELEESLGPRAFEMPPELPLV